MPFLSGDTTYIFYIQVGITEYVNRRDDCTIGDMRIDYNTHTHTLLHILVNAFSLAYQPREDRVTDTQARVMQWVNGRDDCGKKKTDKEIRLPTQ